MDQLARIRSSKGPAPAAKMRSANCRPSALGSVALPVTMSRSSREPSGSATNPRKVIISPLSSAYAAIGDWQLPPNRAANARSASMTLRVAECSRV